MKTLKNRSILNCRDCRSALGAWMIRIKAKTTGNPAPSITLYIDYLHYMTAYYELGTTRTGTATGNALDVCGINCGIRVWKVNSDDSETEISAGSPVATVTGPCNAGGNLNNTYTPGQTADCVAVVVRLYRINSIMDFGSAFDQGGFPMTFMTEDLNTTLQNATWTVHYYFWYSGISEETYFRFGNSTYDSRIANFTYAAAPPPAVGILAQVM